MTTGIRCADRPANVQAAGKQPTAVAGIGPGSLTWIGPGNIGGLINGLAIDPTNPSRIFAATWSGLWKSSDAGASWSMVTTLDGGRVKVIDSVGFAPSIVYATVSSPDHGLLHVYAYPNPGSGQAPIFLGVASVGVNRPDVGAVYGSRYNDSGYTLTVDRAATGLAPGVYNIVVHSHSTVTGAFNNVALVQVTLQ